MIVTVTLNPCVDLNLEVEAFSFTEPLRALRERKRAGGKGMNASVALDLLKAPTTAVALLGGATGREYAQLAQATIRFPVSVVECAGNTRTNIVITARADRRHLKVNQQGAHIESGDLDRVSGALSDLVQPGDFLVLAGSLPPGAPDDTYAKWIHPFRSRGCFVALDADGAALREGLKARPHLIKPNRQELERLLARELCSEDEIIRAGKELAPELCDMCLVSDGANAAYFFARDCCLKGIPPPAQGSAVGAGDACLAGMLKGLSTDADSLREAFRLALACGSAAASMPDTEYFTPAILAGMLDKVVLS